MKNADFPDHAIAHTVHQKQIETQNLMKVVEINEFFEEEKLEVGNKEPVLKVIEIKEFESIIITEEKEQKFKEQNHSCRVCMCEFKKGEYMTTIRCLHLFHKECITKWLTT